MNKKLLTLILSVLLLAACGDNENATTNIEDSGNNSEEEANNEDNDVESDGNSNDADSEDNTFVIAQGADIDTFDVHDHSSVITESVHVNMFSYLVKNEGDSHSGDLATDWELIDDTTWEFD